VEFSIGRRFFWNNFLAWKVVVKKKAESAKTAEGTKQRLKTEGATAAKSTSTVTHLPGR
jgi:hypothetical protein